MALILSFGALLALLILVSHAVLQNQAIVWNFTNSLAILLKLKLK